MDHVSKVRLRGQLPNCRDVALQMLELGFNPLPPKEDGTKAPDAGTEWPKLIANRELINRWYGNGYRRTGIGVNCGHGGLELFEFEGRAVDEGLERQFRKRAKAVGLGALLERIDNGYQEMTPSGGIHWFYRCPNPKGTKLAQRPATETELAAEPKVKFKTLIETKGKGGYAVVAPSNGAVHPDGGCWELARGGWGSVAEITEDEHAALLELARSFDQKPARPAETPAAASQGVGGRPGDALNSQASWADVLEPNGWTLVYERNGEAYWRRPGKSEGISATTNWGGHDLLKVFSTSTPFDIERSYTKFTALTILTTGKAHPDPADFTEVARQLHEQGFVHKSDSYEELVDRRLLDLRAREEAKSRYAAEQRASDDPLVQKVGQALMQLEAADVQTDHTEHWFTEDDIYELPPVDWVIAGILENRGASVVWGEPGIGKTFALLGMAKAVSKGQPWHGHPTQRGAVLFYESEDVRQFQDRLDAFNDYHGWTRGSEPGLRFVGESVDLTTATGIAAVIRTGLELERQTSKLRLVVIDPLIENMSGDENTEGMEAFSRALRVIASELDCAVVVGHHSNASGVRERGNAKLRARMTGMMRMEELSGGVVGFVVEKQRNARRVAMELVKTEHLKSIVLEHQEEMPLEDYLARRDQMREVAKATRRAGKVKLRNEAAEALLLETVREEPGLSKTALLKKSLGKGVGTSWLEIALAALVADGKIEVREGQRKAQLHYPLQPAG